MTADEVDTEAARRYLAAAPCHPTWAQLSEYTKDAWRELVAREEAEDALG